MRKRTLLTIVLISLMVMISLLVFLVIFLLRGSSNVDDNLVAAPDARRKIHRVVDPFAGREVDAVRLVQKRKVLDPAYVQEVLDARAKLKEELERPKTKVRGAPPPEELIDPATIPPRHVTIEELINRKYLEDRFQMSFLERGNWRALHLDTDSPGEIVADPQYEVYLDYRDEEVVVGPVWVVDVETGDVVPRNEMAQLFEITPDNFDNIQEIQSKPARVVRAITSHKFQSGIELGGVFLLHFINRAERQRNEGDRIIGWTVQHDFREYYNAFFQWVEGGEHRVARFRFNWKAQRLEPRGLLAIDLMAEGEDRAPASPVSIWPQSYKNDLNIPRQARWLSGACKDGDNRSLCNAFAKVLEQHHFIESVQWLLTSGESAAEKFRDCQERQQCRWNIVLASGADNPDNNENLFKIEYEYVIGGRKSSIGFMVDSETDTITPLDEISGWAFWSVTPRT